MTIILYLKGNEITFQLLSQAFCKLKVVNSYECRWLRNGESKQIEIA